ncbi:MULTISPECIES: hypothetical protein [Mycobacterium]|uniref:Uncharacterized protein n=2 Tax=Mycobacterium TaxID=1763 RepID=A0A9P3V0B5_9MYCO|nr:MULTISPECIES: hypothetical protein [Mycobacterium]MCV7008709.1 hypothetical protein [Mycobacterium gordonae]ODR24255.1 hypothetical protein BHQ23_01430 [Mycobacterium gordonae]ORV75544.1 hypothetical protein AWC08_33485 [Mycobacterium gordonae]GLD33466.1 hypothetical protein Mkiyose1413_53490 [Mycobacterium kiyosense]GLD38993.1 hypothetical protein Mkiyose1595_52130 [Mycobacterium kiyosense]
MRFEEAGVAVIGDQDWTVAEWSRDGALMVKLGDPSGRDVQVELERDAMSWPAEVLADRIMRLHRLALMRLRAETRERSRKESGVEWSLQAGWPSLVDVDEYRLTIDF